MNALNFSKCPHCGYKLHSEKDTSSGEEIREYFCSNCKWSESVNNGPALWKILSDAQEEEDLQKEASKRSEINPKGDREANK